MLHQAKTKRIDLRASEQMVAMLEQQAAGADMTKSRYITYLIEREYKARHVVMDEVE